MVQVPYIETLEFDTTWNRCEHPLDVLSYRLKRHASLGQALLEHTVQDLSRATVVARVLLEEARQFARFRNRRDGCHHWVARRIIRWRAGCSVLYRATGHVA